MPIDRGILEKQLQAIGEGPRWWDCREMRDLPAVLRDREEMLAIASGKVARVRWLRRTWLIVVTDERVIFMRSGRRAWRQMDIPADQLRRVTMRVGPFRGRVRIMAAGHKYQMLVTRDAAYKIVAAINSIASDLEQVKGFGPTRIVRRVIDHVMALPVAVAEPVPGVLPPSTLPQLAAKASAPQDERVHDLESQIDDLQHQVKFLEDLLRERKGAETKF